MEKNCFECGDPIRGRADKRFCSDMCRNSYNNRINSDTNNLVRNVNNILRRNRRIIEHLLEENLSRISRLKLSEKGFNFMFYTSRSENKKGSVYYYCYDFGYEALDKDAVYLVRKNETGLLSTEKKKDSEMNEVM